MARLTEPGHFIGNYTYNTEYVFLLEGGIDVVQGATGTTLNRVVSSAADGAAFGSLVAPTRHRETVGFSLEPQGFFDENPALDAPGG